MVKIPNRLEDLYPATAIEKILEAVQQPDISGRVRETLNKVGLGDVNPLERVQHAWQQARSWLDSMAGDANWDRDSLLINATGKLFGSDLGPVPVSSAIAQVFVKHATRFHDPGLHDRQVENTLRHEFQSTGCFAGSLSAALRHLIGNRQVLIAKTDLVRIPRLGNVASMLAGLQVTEVGPANGCSSQDWQIAVSNSNDSESCVLLVSPNALSASDGQQQNTAAIEAAKESSVPVFQLSADAVVHEALSQKLNMPPLRRADGVAALVAPLHLLLAAPTGALVLGEEIRIESLGSALQESGDALAWPQAAAAMVALQLPSLQEDLGSGSLPLMLVNSENLKDRAERIAIQLNGVGPVKSAQATSRIANLGDAPWNRYALDNWAVEMYCGSAVQKLADEINVGHSEGDDALPAIKCIVEGEKIILDLRFVDPQDDHLLVTSILGPIPGDESSHSNSPIHGELVDEE